VSSETRFGQLGNSQLGRPRDENIFRGHERLRDPLELVATLSA
jgi:hypothetical protein